MSRPNRTLFTEVLPLLLLGNLLGDRLYMPWGDTANLQGVCASNIGGVTINNLRDFAYNGGGLAAMRDVFVTHMDHFVTRCWDQCACLYSPHLRAAPPPRRRPFDLRACRATQTRAKASMARCPASTAGTRATPRRPTRTSRSSSRGTTSRRSALARSTSRSAATACTSGATTSR